MQDGCQCVDLGTFVDRDVPVVWGREKVSGGFWGGEVDHSSPVGDLRRKQGGTLGQGEVNEVDGGGAKENVGGVEVRVQPSQGAMPLC